MAFAWHLYGICIERRRKYIHNEIIVGYKKFKMVDEKKIMAGLFKTRVHLIFGIYILFFCDTRVTVLRLNKNGCHIGVIENRTVQYPCNACRIKFLKGTPSQSTQSPGLAPFLYCFH